MKSGILLELMAKTSKTPKETNATEASSAFAVIKTGGKQYRVASGDTITVEKLIGEYKVGDKVEFNEVLLSDNGSETKVGAPFVSGAKVTGEIAAIGRHAKVIIMRYKQKSRAGTPKNGHRQSYFKVKINSIA
ncbi:MAG: ribosomal protein [Candidatus Parcubacteria bacterium]|jgi:large subunit ribosomal protein L21